MDEFRKNKEIEMKWIKFPRNWKRKENNSIPMEIGKERIIQFQIEVGIQKSSPFNEQDTPIYIHGVY